MENTASRSRITNSDLARLVSLCPGCVWSYPKMATGGYSALNTASRDRRLLMGLGEGILGGVMNQSRLRSTPTPPTRKASALGPSATSRDRIARLDEV